MTSRLLDWLGISLLLLLQVVLFEIIGIARVVGKCLVPMIACRSRSRSCDLTPWMLLEMMEIISGVVSSVKPVSGGSGSVGDQFASGAGMCSNNYNFR